MYKSKKDKSKKDLHKYMKINVPKQNLRKHKNLLKLNKEKEDLKNVKIIEDLFKNINDIADEMKNKLTNLDDEIKMIINVNNIKCEGLICSFYTDCLKPFGKFNKFENKYLCNLCGC